MFHPSHMNAEGPARRIAIVGSGISGLSAAWLLSRRHQVTLYEAEKRPGGHSNTVTVETSAGPVPVDTGFIVYNERNYPNLTAFFDHLGVKTEVSDMSFSASINQGALEYSSFNLNTFLGQRTNVIRPRFWRMFSDIVRFYREAPAILRSREATTMAVTLGEYLERNNYAPCFIEDHLLPMGAAIWSTDASQMRDYPLLAFVRFFASHGLLTFIDRPIWRTVTGGSRQYVQKIVADLPDVRLGRPVTRIERQGPQVTIHDVSGASDTFDAVVIAAHADDALKLLDTPSVEENALLGAFRYTDNRAVLHADDSFMPQRRRVWASWNYVGDRETQASQKLCVTYWMNRLQNLKSPQQLFVTLNPARAVAEDKVIASFDYRHPLFDGPAIAAQPHLWHLQGQNNTYYAGAYFGHGFHEDGLQAGLAAAELVGGVKRPWNVREESGRIHLPPLAEAAE